MEGGHRPGFQNSVMCVCGGIESELGRGAKCGEGGRVEARVVRRHEDLHLTLSFSLYILSPGQLNPSLL